MTIRLSTPANSYTQQAAYWQTGWNIGGGVEWAFNDHWTLRGEDIYDQFGSSTYPFLQLDPKGFDPRAAKLDENTARL